MKDHSRESKVFFKKINRKQQAQDILFCGVLDNTTGAHFMNLILL